MSKAETTNLIKDSADPKMGSFDKANGLMGLIGLGFGRGILAPFFLILEIIPIFPPFGT